MLYRSDVQIGVTQDPVALPMAIPVPFPLDPSFCRQNLSLQLFAGASLLDVSGTIVSHGCHFDGSYWDTYCNRCYCQFCVRRGNAYSVKRRWIHVPIVSILHSSLYAWRETLIGVWCHKARGGDAELYFTWSLLCFRGPMSTWLFCHRYHDMAWFEPPPFATAWP